MRMLLTSKRNSLIRVAYVQLDQSFAKNPDKCRIVGEPNKYIRMWKYGTGKLFNKFISLFKLKRVLICEYEYENGIIQKGQT